MMRESNPSEDGKWEAVNTKRDHLLWLTQIRKINRSIFRIANINKAAYRVSYRKGGGRRRNVGSKCRRHAYFRELRVLTCVGDSIHFGVHSRPRTFKQLGWNNMPGSCEEGWFKFPCPPQALNSPAVSQQQRGPVTLTSSFPGLCVCGRATGEGFVSRKGTLLLTDVVMKRAAPSWSGVI